MNPWDSRYRWYGWLTLIDYRFFQRALILGPERMQFYLVLAALGLGLISLAGYKAVERKRQMEERRRRTLADIRAALDA